MSERQLLFCFYSSLITHHSSLLFSAAEEVDNLDAVAFVEIGLRPVGAADDLAIAFDGEAFADERELPDQIVERRSRLHFAAFPVDFDAQGFLLGLRSRRKNDASHLCIFAADDGAYEDGGAAGRKARQGRKDNGDAVAVGRRRAD